MTQTIDYKVEDSNNYKKKLSNNHKQISKINEQSKYFQFQFPQKQYDINLNFISPAYIHIITIKIQKTNSIQLEFFYKEQTKYYYKQIFKEDKPISINTRQNQKQLIDKVHIKLRNVDETQSSKIHYIIFKGKKKQEQKKIQSIRNLSKQQQFSKSNKKQSIKLQSLKNYQSKSYKKTSPQELEQSALKFSFKKQQQKYNYQKNQKQFKKKDSIQDLNSFKNKSIKNKQKQKPIFQPYKQQEILQLDNDLSNQHFGYDVVQYNKVKNIYKNVTHEWIESQRKAEIKLGIKEQHSLANRIKTQIFKNTSFYLSNLDYQLKKQLNDFIIELGGNLINNLKDGCIVVTDNMNGQQMLKAKKNFHNIIFVIPLYIRQCYSTNSKLNQQQYHP